MRRVFPLFAAAVFLSGCAATSYMNLTDVSAVQVAENIESQSRSLKYFSSSGYGNFETMNGAYSARFDLSVRRPSSAFVSLYGPLGIKVMQVKLTADSLLVYNSMRNEVFVARPTEDNLRNLLMIASNGTSLTDLLLDLMTPISHLEAPTCTSHASGNVVNYTYVNEDTVEKYTVDGEYMRTRDYEKLVDGETVMKIGYSDFTSIDDMYFPRSVSFQDTKRGISAKLFYQDISLNHKGRVDFIVPPDAKRVIIY